MNAAMRSADPRFLIGIPRALAASRAMRWPGRRISTTPTSAARARALGVDTDLETLRGRPGATLPPGHRRRCRRDRVHVGRDRSVEGSALHARTARRAARCDRRRCTTSTATTGWSPRSRRSRSYGPLLGIPSVVPDMDVTAPATLTAEALGEAVCRVEATLVFASPAALANVVATADRLTPAHRDAFDRVRLLLSAGAPVGPALLSEAADAVPERDRGHAVRHDRVPADREHHTPGDRVGLGRRRRLRRHAAPIGRRSDPSARRGRPDPRCGRRRRDRRACSTRPAGLRPAVAHRTRRIATAWLARDG